MKSKTKIEKQARKKSSPILVSTIIASKKNPSWMRVAEILSSSRRRKISVNLSDIEKEAKEGEKIVVPGKVLSQGEVSKKIKIAALSFSKNALKKLLNSKSEVSTILEEIKKNPEAKGVKFYTKPD